MLAQGLPFFSSERPCPAATIYGILVPMMAISCFVRGVVSTAGGDVTRLVRNWEASVERYRIRRTCGNRRYWSDGESAGSAHGPPRDRRQGGCRPLRTIR